MSDYYSLTRNDVINLIEGDFPVILELGCSEGFTTEAAKRKFKSSVSYGVELSTQASEKAKSRIDKVYNVNLEDFDFPFENESIDLIICADVLEHLNDIWKVLNETNRILSSDGFLIASLPNISHITVLLKIIFNKFKYEESGILDKSHLRFFTKYTIENIFGDSGFEIVKVSSNKSNSLKFIIFNFITFNLFERFSIYQYLIVARKIDRNYNQSI